MRLVGGPPFRARAYARGAKALESLHRARPEAYGSALAKHTGSDAHWRRLGEVGRELASPTVADLDTVEVAEEPELCTGTCLARASAMKPESQNGTRTPREGPGRPASAAGGGPANAADVGPLERLARLAARWSSNSLGFGTALGVVLVWLATGPFLHYSTTWQLVINTGTTIITFLMVFLIQRSQTKDALAIQVKLDELVAALAGASNRLVAAEDLSEADLEDLHRRYRMLSERARHLTDKQASLSLEAPREGTRRNGKKRPVSQRTSG